MRPYSWRKTICGMKKVNCSFHVASDDSSTLNLTIMSLELWIFEVFGTCGTKFLYRFGLYASQSFVSIVYYDCRRQRMQFVGSEIRKVIGGSCKILLLIHLYVFYFGLSIIGTIKITGARLYIRNAYKWVGTISHVSFNLNT